MAMISLVIILLAWFYPIIRETGTIKKNNYGNYLPPSELQVF